MLTPSFLHRFRGAVLRIPSPVLVILHLWGYHPLRQVVPGHFDFDHEEAAGSYNSTSPNSFLSGFGLDSSRFARRYSGNPSWFLFLLLLGCFRSEGSLSHMGVPRVLFVEGSPIRVSPDLRLRAPTRSLSQLVTPFVSAQAEPSIRRRIMPSPLGTHIRFALVLRLLVLPMHTVSLHRGHGVFTRTVALHSLHPQELLESCTIMFWPVAYLLPSSRPCRFLRR